MTEHSKENQVSKKSLFKSIDQIVFKQVDNFLNSSHHQKLSEQLADLDQNSKKYLNHFLTLLFIALPAFLVFQMSSTNRELREELHTKKETLSTIYQLRETRNQSEALSQSLLSPVAINSQSDLQNRLTNRLRNLNIAADKVRIESFDSYQKTDQITEQEIRIRINQMTLTDLTGFLGVALNEYRLKSRYVELNRDDNSQLIDGTIEFLHLRRASSEPSDT